MSEDRDARTPEDRGGPGGDKREQNAMLLGGGISCILGILLGVGGIVAALLGGGANISAGAVGAALGVLGYFLGARRLATATVILCVVAIFFGLAASQGLIPGLAPSDHELPSRKSQF